MKPSHKLSQFDLLGCATSQRGNISKPLWYIFHSYSINHSFQMIRYDLKTPFSVPPMTVDSLLCEVLWAAELACWNGTMQIQLIIIVGWHSVLALISNTSTDCQQSPIFSPSDYIWKRFKLKLSKNQIWTESVIALLWPVLKTVRSFFNLLGNGASDDPSS